MPASTGKTGRGVSFQIDLTASPVTWITVGNARSISLTGRQADELDFTHLLSSGGYRELRQGFKDGGSIAVEFHFDPTDESHVAETDGFLGLFDSGVVFNWRMNFSGAGWPWALVGQGFISNPGDIDVNVDGPITGNATVRNTGPVELAAVA
jgi:hypothetical protein